MFAHGLKLRVGGVTIGLELPNRSLRDFYLQYFMGNVSESKPDLTLDIRIMNPKTPFEMVPDSLFHAKRKKDKGFLMEGGIMEGWYSPEKKRGKVFIHPVLLETDCKRVFEQILYQAYVTAAGDIYGKAPLIHSSGVIRDGKGYIFLGASEAGKSTVAGLSRAFQVVNDEITIADMSDGVPRLISTPFNGLFREKSAGQAPLSGIFLLRKDREHRVLPAEGGEAVKLIASQIIPPVGLEGYISHGDYIRQVDIALELSRNIPVFDMHFAKDEGFWDAIGELGR